MSGYTWGEQPEDTRTIKLNTNENPYPPSSRVQDALRNLDSTSLRTYPQPTADQLRDAIAHHHGTRREQVVVTNGGDEALRLAFTTYVEPGKSFAMASPSYSLYPVLANIHDATVVEVGLTPDWHLPRDFTDKVNAAGAQLTCVVNPHAPSGTLTSTEVLADIADNLTGLLLIDEAYADFIDPTLQYNSAELLKHHHNVLILRTFSKGYSLAGLRLGYLLGDQSLIDPIVAKTRDSYNINHISQILGLAAFKDQDYAQQTWHQVRQDRATLGADLAELGLESPVSDANFLLVQVPPDAHKNAAQLYEHLKTEGILVRYFSTPPLTDKLRITIGTHEQNQRLILALKQVLK